VFSFSLVKIQLSFLFDVDMHILIGKALKHFIHTIEILARKGENSYKLSKIGNI